ncbi:D-arabinitol 4-dehydrogenase [Pantoea agglomerans]|uniref:D-arabinitol 4-dehydrogenase n=1 Tax=Enterobacter agglomerans TaxID=549 RepID=UPI0010C0C6D0|nr:D-arabinitol 4-dehydrogenase [Pantoea agglomerans]MBD8142599.1 mannitol dehydrogenase family protein [Pantoea agglomerans]MBD8180254.1 mannitol dehydrogenase family protein [Pantoea agglomerans]MBD8220307.1 mannitol dehydrogenase family protein [Pantoea agglomerans]MBN9928950.1 mannitol dehydrogenase family protein [Pantoea agglomerans]TKJ60526.1 D-arabinitol 4-dehydrogenase [Pantoea agglomerans]
MNNQSVWMHIGAGSFHRAHQAWYLHKLREQGDERWSIALGNIRNDAVPLLNQLAAQQGEYVLETVTPEGKRDYETITSLRKILPWDSDIRALIEQGASAETRVISFTVTEAGYYLTPAFTLDLNQADVKADLGGDIRTLYGALSHILTQRVAQGGAPVTLLNCDNLRHNGERFRDAFLAFLTAKGDTTLADWVRTQTRSPNTMVDRITPRPTPEVAERVQAATGKQDGAAVMAESFIQWVIEDDFIAGRPALEKVGVELVESVLPWEEAKIRILNATHAAIAWAGTLIGLNYIDESTSHPAIYQLAHDYVTQDVIPSLSPSPLDLADYRDVVLARFSNPYIKDTNQRVGADGLSKIPGMVTPTLQQCYQRGAQPTATAVIPALFFLFMQRWANDDLPYRYQDGALQADTLRKQFASADPLHAYLSDSALFAELASDKAFHELVTRRVASLQQWLNQPELAAV